MYEISNETKALFVVALTVLLFGGSIIVSVELFKIVLITVLSLGLIALCCKVLYDVVLFGLNKK
jgi:hypothetical protein